MKGLKRIQIPLFLKNMRKVSLLKEDINSAQAVIGGASGGPRDLDPRDEVTCHSCNERKLLSHPRRGLLVWY